MNPRRIWLALAGALLVLVFAACSNFGPPAESDSGPDLAPQLHLDGIFELDVSPVVDPAPGDPLFIGNANAVDETKTDPNLDGDDWNTVLFGGGSAFANTGVLADGGQIGVAFVDDIAKQSKDVNEIFTWEWVIVDGNKPGALPAKTNITNAYAAAYQVDVPENGEPAHEELITFFGMDRLSNEGSADIGFWFLKGPIDLVPDDPTCFETDNNGDSVIDELDWIGCTGEFSGAHEIGDVLVLSTFTKGGRVPGIDVYMWDPPNATYSGVLKEIALGADCTLVPNDAQCAVVNSTIQYAPWPYQAKFPEDAPEPIDLDADALPDDFPPGHLFEGGIELSHHGIEGCFSTFLAETRSSASITSELKDFTFGSFNVCSIDVEKAGPELAKAGDVASYSVTIENTGTYRLYKDTIVDSLYGDLTADSGCGAYLEPGESCTIHYDYTVPAEAVSPVENTVTAIYREYEDLHGAAFTSHASWSLDVFEPRIELTKTGDDLSKVGDTVTYSITLENTSTGTAPDLTCTVTDAEIGFSASVTLASGETETWTPSHEILPDDPDPFVNEAHAICSPIGFVNDVEDFAEHTVELFQPAIDIAKSGTPLAKVGDTVDYVVTLANESSEDTPPLVCVVEDTLVGTLFEGVLPLGDTVLTPSRTVEAGDPDPLSNTVTMTCSPEGFQNVLEASSSHDVELFQPALTFEKSGTELSKVGDDVDYTLTLANASSVDTPEMECTITDAVLGIDESFVLPSGGTAILQATRTVEASDPDPLTNTADASCSPVGFPNVYDRSDSHTVELFQPGVAITKTGTELSKAGDVVIYDVSIENTSSLDTPDLILDSIGDTVLGDLASPADAAGCSTLAAGTSCSFSVEYLVQVDDPDPLVNVVEVHYHPLGFENDIWASDDHSVELFDFAVGIAKRGTDLAKVGDVVDYVITLTNDSSPDTPALDCVVEDDLLGTLFDDVLPLGDTVLNPSRTVEAGDADPLPNEVTMTCSPQGFDNILEVSASHETNLFQPSIEFEKTGTELSKVGDDVDYTLTLDNTSSADTPNLVCTITDAVLAIDETVELPSGSTAVIERTRTVDASDPDPLMNTADVSCSPIGFPNVYEASDSHTVELFQPSVDIDKTGTALSKVGDFVEYGFVVTNTSSPDAPALMLDSMSDSVLGDLMTPAVASGCADLAPGAACAFFVSRPVLATDPDPLENDVTVHYHPDGFVNDVQASDDHVVELFQPAVSITKTGDTLSKVGDSAVVEFLISNVSSADAPDLVLDQMDDTVLGDLTGVATSAGCGTLASGASCAFTVTRTVQPTDPDPLGNVATVHYHPAGFANDLSASDDHSIELFQPSLTIEKTGDAYTKVGDPIHYSVRIENTSSTDTPPLELISFSDTLATGVTVPSSCEVLDPGEVCILEYSYTVQASDDDTTLANTATAVYRVTGFGNELEASDGWTATLLHPSFSLSNRCDSTEPVPIGGPAEFYREVTNTGDVPLLVTLDGGAEVLVGVGNSVFATISVAGPFDGQATVDDTATASFRVPDDYLAPNTGDATEDASCRVGSRTELLKTTNGFVDPSYDWVFEIFEGPNQGDGSGFLSGPTLASASTYLDGDGVLEFAANLDPLETYTICEHGLPVGWTSTWIGIDPLDVYDPGLSDSPPEFLGYYCVDFGDGTSYPLYAGETLAFEVDNTSPQGEARTPGYWKNWSSCSNGNQFDKGYYDDPENDFWTIDEALVELSDPTFYIGLVDLTTTSVPATETCEVGVGILSNEEIEFSGKKPKVHANDPAYKLARNLLAYELNQAADAATCAEAMGAATDGQALLVSLGFDGTGDYLKPKDALYDDANTLASILDLYNNNLLCP